MNIYLNANKGMKTKFKTQRKHDMGEQWARDPNSYTTEAHLHICTSAHLEWWSEAQQATNWKVCCGFLALPRTHCQGRNVEMQTARVRKEGFIRQQPILRLHTLTFNTQGSAPWSLPGVPLTHREETGSPVPLETSRRNQDISRGTNASDAYTIPG